MLFECLTSRGFKFQKSQSGFLKACQSFGLTINCYLLQGYFVDDAHCGLGIVNFLRFSDSEHYQLILQSQMSTKEYLKYDIIVAVFLGAYYFLTRGSLAATTSTGIQTFYMIEIGAAILIQVLLMIFDNAEARPWVASMRFGAIVYFLGMVLIVTKLGLLSIWFIILFCVSEGIHITLLLDQSQMKEDDQQNLFGSYQFNNAINENSHQQMLLPANSDPAQQSLIAQQRTNFFEQQRILQEIQRRNEEASRAQV